MTNSPPGAPPGGPNHQSAREVANEMLLVTIDTVVGREISPEILQEIRSDPTRILGEIKNGLQNNIILRRIDMHRNGGGNIASDEEINRIQAQHPGKPREELIQIIQNRETARIKKNEEICAQLIGRIQSLVMKQESLIGLLESQYVSLIDTDDKKRRLREAVRKLPKNIIEYYLYTPSVQKKWLEEVFPGEREAIMGKPDVGSLFREVSTRGSLDARNILESISEQYAKYSFVPNAESISKLLLTYGGASQDEKKKLFERLGTTIDIGYAMEHKLVDLPTVHKMLVDTFGQTYMNLSPEEQARMRGVMKDANGNDIRSGRGAFASYALEIPVTYLTNLDIFFQTTLVDGEDIPSREHTIAIESIQKNLESRIEHQDRGLDILGKIKKEQEIKYGTGCNYDIHTAFLQYVKGHVKGSENTEKVQGIENFGVGSIMKMEHNGEIFYYELQKGNGDLGNVTTSVYGGNELGISVRTSLVKKNGETSYLESQGVEEISYDDLYRNFEDAGGRFTVLSRDEFRRDLTSSGIQDERDSPVTVDNIELKLNKLDPKGSKFGFQKGLYFESAATREDGTAGTEMWRVEKINRNANTVDLVNSMGGTQKNISIENIYKIAKRYPNQFRRKKVLTNRNFLRELQSAGLTKNATLRAGGIYDAFPEKDINGQEIPGKVKHIQYFTQGEYRIRILNIENGFVVFQKYDGKGKPIGSVEWFSFPDFLSDIQEGKYVATSMSYDDKDPVELGSTMKGSLMKRIFQMQNFMSMKMGIQTIGKGIKEWLDQGTRLDGAKFALKLSKFIPIDSVRAEVYSAITQGSKEILEKILKVLGGIPGPEARKKCIEIASNKDSRPEEVAGAIMFLSGSYGHFYAEDLKGYQTVVTENNIRTKKRGTYMFFDAFVTTLGLDFWKMREHCYLKARSEVDKGEEPTEEQMVLYLLKWIDGNSSDHPYPASVMKAIGGPTPFNNKLKEGKNKARDKGKDDAGMISPQSRIEKGIGALGNRELYKWWGAMESTLGKTQNPKDQCLPFIFAVGGFSKFLDSSEQQKIKGFAESDVSFHAYAFLKNNTLNEKYLTVVRLALRDMGGDELVKEFDKIRAKLQPGTPDNEFQSAVGKMRAFWEANCDKGLHDMLQGQNGWLTTKAQDAKHKAPIGNYLEAWKNGTFMQAGTTPNKTNGWYEQYGWSNNMIPAFSEEPDAWGYRSLKHMLEKIHFRGGSYNRANIDSETVERLWWPIINYMTSEKGFKDISSYGSNEAMRKKQFLLFRKEIIYYLSQGFQARFEIGKLTSQAEKDKAIQGYLDDYTILHDLRKMGIDPKVIFMQDLEQKNEESDYQAWSGGTVADTVKRTQGLTTKTLNPDV